MAGIRYFENGSLGCNTYTPSELEAFEDNSLLDLSRCFFGNPVPGDVLVLCSDPDAIIDGNPCAVPYVKEVCSSVAEAEESISSMMVRDWEDGKSLRKYVAVRVGYEPLPMKPGLDVLDGDECDGIALIDWNDSEEFGREELYAVEVPLLGDSISVYVCDGVEYLPCDWQCVQPLSLLRVGDMEAGWYTVEEFATLYDYIYS